MDRLKLVAEARAWLRTPWLHAQAVKGRGCDCLGFIRGVMIACDLLPAGFLDRDDVLAYCGYGRMPDGRLKKALDHFLPSIHVAEIALGDLVLIDYGAGPQHVAIVAEHPHGGLSLIHALQHGVAEHRLDEKWRGRIVAAYRLDLGATGTSECCGSCKAGGSCGA